MSAILERYAEKFQASKELAERGMKVIPGAGTASRVAYPFNVYIDHAQGPLKWDVDGNEIIDYVMGSGALLLGHDHPNVIEALRERIGQGIHVLSNPLAIEWAEMIQGMIPSAERVRFTGSGTESTYLALRLARTYTGKKKIVKFQGHFHGWHDYVTPQSGLNTEVGIPCETLSTVMVLEPDISAVERLLAEDQDIVAVILEPTGAHWGQLPLPNPDFLQEVTRRSGVVMIMDEVITGFRMSRGGAQERFGVVPDMTTLSKVAGGGLACGIVAGRSDILDLMVSDDNSKRVINTGTFNGNPLAAAAGIACLSTISSEPINETADRAAARLKRGLADALIKMEVTGHVHGVSSIVHVILGEECECDGEICTMPHDRIIEAGTTVNPSHRRESGYLRMAMLNEGIDPMGGSEFMVSSSHSDAEVDRTVVAFERVLAALRDEGRLT